jgi:O-methyltransferase
MLTKLLADVFRQRGRNNVAQSAPSSPPTLGRIQKLVAAAERAPIDSHLRILYGEVTIAGRPLLELTAEAMQRSNTWNPPAKTIHRRERTFNLARYFLYASTLPGRQIECGVFNGCSALACCLARRAAQAEFNGAPLHLVDSFEGLSAPRAEDWFQIGSAGGETTASTPPLWPANNFKARLEDVKAVFASFPDVQIHKGWIPAALEQLPEARWSFVHIDLDLYEPTGACLEYFLPRMVPGGVIVCDDYGSLMFPGAARAWDEVLVSRGAPFVELPTGQSVFMAEG